MATGKLTNIVGAISKRLFQQASYTVSNTVTLTLPFTPAEGQTYLVFFLYYTGADSIAMDIRTVNYVNASAVRSAWLVKNSSYNLNGIIPSGNNLTFSFNETVYVSTFFVRINNF